MGKAFCRNEIVDYFFILDEKDSLFKIVDEFYDLALDIDEDEIFELIKENPIANYFFKRDTASIISDKDSFEKIDKADYLPFSNDVLLCDDTTDVVEIRNKFGVLALHLEDEFLNDQNFNFGYTLERDKECMFKCWADVIDPKPFIPSNSAILVDNFIWKNKAEFHNENTENLYEIISKIIPKDLVVPFQLLINIDFRNAGIEKKEAEEKLKKVKKNLEKLTGKAVEVGVSSHSNPKLFHSRVILTNHHYFYSDRGFTILKNGKIKDATYGTRNWVFYGIENYVGEINKHHHNNLIRNLKKSTNDNSSIDTDAIYNVGDWKNRLLN
tara:strand:- start:417 stop:1394 length:978 start_codon:yes stop_codon:yes gene_type:complete